MQAQVDFEAGSTSAQHSLDSWRLELEPALMLLMLDPMLRKCSPRDGTNSMRRT